MMGERARRDLDKNSFESKCPQYLIICHNSSMRSLCTSAFVVDSGLYPIDNLSQVRTMVF
jgi:hypothetical protein